MTTVSVQGVTITGTKTAVITIDKSVVFAKGAPWWIPYAVCFSSPVPFRNAFGQMTTLGLLPLCNARFFSPGAGNGEREDRQGDMGDGGWGDRSADGYDDGGWGVGSGFGHYLPASPPCVTSILPDRLGDVVETLQLPGYDPRFH
jgi:hypothetical protein